MSEAKAFFSEVSSWSIEALDEDIARYFYYFDDMSLIEKGNKNLVIGRKGTGKTAIAEYIKNKDGKEVNAKLLSFKNFPFNDVYNLNDDSYTSPNQYISMWEYVIYCTICNMMITDKSVDILRRRELSQFFNFDIENALSHSIKRINDRGFNVNIFGLGGGMTSAQDSKLPQLNFEQKNSILLSYIKSHISKTSYYILFDSLDEDYKGILKPDRKEKYFDLLIGLMKAVQNVRRSLSGQANVTPLVFLRDDIFDLCRDPDKNKWLDRAIVLDWNPHNLKNLIAYRLSKAAGQNNEILPFNEIWHKYFEHSVRLNRKHQKREDSFSYILRFTYMRPRDLVSYVRECAKLADERNESFVAGSVIKEANKGHSEYLRREVIDETYSIIDNVSEILDMLAEQRKSIFSQIEFRDLYNQNFNDLKEGNGYYNLDASEILKLLYHFNVIGNILRGSNHQIYSYSSNNKKLNPRERVCVHVGLLKALDIW